MTHLVTIQQISKHKDIPAETTLKTWLQIALQGHHQDVEITLRIVDEAESAALNQTYRQKAGATNVLSFVYQIEPVFGDIVLCAPLIASEAKAQNKILVAHWAHLVIHGALHLLGHDHVHEKETAVMEKLEVKLLMQLGFTNPYV